MTKPPFVGVPEIDLDEMARLMRERDKREKAAAKPQRLDPKRTLGFAGRAELLRLWDLMDADQQEQLLLAAEGTVARDGDQAQVPLIRTGKK